MLSSICLILLFLKIHGKTTALLILSWYAVLVQLVGSTCERLVKKSESYLFTQEQFDFPESAAISSRRKVLNDPLQQNGPCSLWKRVLLSVEELPQRMTELQIDAAISLLPPVYTALRISAVTIRSFDSRIRLKRI